MDESSQGLFRITVSVLVHKIKTVVSQEGGIVVHLLHGYLNGRAQPQCTVREGHVPGSLEANQQLVIWRSIAAAVLDDHGGSSGKKCEVVEQCVVHAGDMDLLSSYWILDKEGLSTQLPL